MKQAWFEVRRGLDVSVVGILVDDVVAKELDGDRYAKFLGETLVGAEVRFMTIGDHLTYEHSTFESAQRAVDMFLVGNTPEQVAKRSRESCPLVPLPELERRGFGRRRGA